MTIEGMSKMKNKGFFIFLIDSCFSLLLAISLFFIFHKYYPTLPNILKLVFLLVMIFILPICLGIIIASINGKETIGRRMIDKYIKDSKRKNSKKK